MAFEDELLIKEQIIQFFPKLAIDANFSVTSPCTDAYNCLAWAANKDNIFWWPAQPPVDGVEWPIDDYDTTFHTLFKVYEKIGYIECDNWQFDAKLKKIALYIDSNGHFTHAARQLRNGLWTSKLGPSWDISHSDPYSIESEAYGTVGGFMSIVF